ncbi:hypothetical protein WMY93_032280, partial [Mugilogobius chulae]
ADTSKSPNRTGTWTVTLGWIIIYLHSDGDRGDGSVRYVLTGEGAGTLFKIDEKSGDIHAVNRFTNVALEGESEFIIKIHDINDNEPRFTKTPTTPECTSVIQVTATDADDATYGNSARVVYSILEGQPYFSVDPDSGLIKTALPGMDREVKENYQVVIQAKDMAGRGRPVRDHHSQHHPVRLSRAATVARELFANLHPTGAIQEGVLAARKPLDFERKRQYSLRVQVENVQVGPRFMSAGPFTDEASVKVVVEDVDEPPVFERAHYILEVKEDAPKNTVIGSVSAADPDDKRSPVRNGSLFTLRELDREENAWHNITVIATSSRIQTVSATDPDEPLGGHRFFFSLAQEAAGKANFSVRDNKDNTAWILTRRNSYSSLQMSLYHVPVVISDGDFPMQSSTSTLTVKVCTCDRDGNMKLCNAEAMTARAGLSTGALVAILLCVVILLMIVVLFAALRRQRKKEPLIISKEDVRDNVVSYNDEGGGEEDTQAFDIGTLRNPEAIEDSKQRRDIIPETYYNPPVRRNILPPPRDNNGDVRDFINQRLQDNDTDPTAPPYDSLATYAYEGNGSVADSLSSLESVTTDGDQDYNYLSEWGPRFKKLADMYGGDDSDRES